MRAFGSRSSILVGGQVRSPKTQPFHIVKRYQQGEEKDSNTVNDRNNGLRMKKEMTMKDKRFSFFADPQEENENPTHIAHIAKAPHANAQTKALTKSAILPTHTVLC